MSARKPVGRVFVGLIVFCVVLSGVGALAGGAFGSVWYGICGLCAVLGLVRVIVCGVALWGGPLSGHPLPMDVEIEAAPVWSILVALYREADCVAGLLEALARLQWPPQCLDLIFVCEADDAPTIAALEALRQTQSARHRFRLVLVPAGGPRTKPHALQTALPFVEGRFVSVYDAEDRPDPSQIRAAFAAFVSGADNLAVVQAPLVACNDTESWIAAQFARDYAVWFRVVLPAFARLSGLLPLGGTSNHFRTQVLRDIGGWDPYNVTEDADLGVRLARHGYGCGLIAPPTWEEAPPRVAAWVKQRGRWIQGHIQTVSVHARTPLRLCQQLGARGTLAFVVGLATGPMSAALTLPCTLALMCQLWRADAGDLPAGWVILPWAIGATGHILATLIACHRDGRHRLLTTLPTLPLYHLLQALAALRAFWRIIFTPSVWDKTDHGAAARRGKGGSKSQTAKQQGETLWSM
jgi:cellulose synthase/poly-beta-1,6-N-acetylglucosamine synthase-like glycosyltransferase